MRNCPQFAGALYAIWGSGAVAVPVHARATVAEIVAALSRTSAAGVLRDPEREDLARKAAAPTGGENVSPTEVENALCRHPGVADVAVIGTPHPRWGEVFAAVLALRPGSRPDPTALAALAAGRLAGYKRPRRFDFVAVLPRNAGGEVEMGPSRRQLQRATRDGGWRTGDRLQVFASSI